MKQFYLITLFLFSLTFGLTNSLLAGTYGGGDGTEGNPFQLGTADHVIELSTTEADWGAFFKLTADIDMAEKTFNSIGYTTTETVLFSGKIDGQNHIVSNLTVTLREGQSDCGFIGYGKNCTISNLGFTNISVETPVAGGGIQGGVGMVGYMEGSGATVTNCFVIGKMSSRNGMGGIVGRLNFGKITNCMASVDFDAYYDNRTGGIVGIVHSGPETAEAAVSNCVAYGFFKKRNAAATLSGGIMGQVDNDIPDIQVASNCYFLASSGGISQPKNSNITTMGKASTIEELKTKNSFTGLNFDDDSGWFMLENGFAALKSFAADKYKVTISATVNPDSSGTGTIDPVSKTVNLGEAATFNFSTEGYVSGITLDGRSLNKDNVSSYTIDAACGFHQMVVAFNSFPAGLESSKLSNLNVYVANGELNINGAANSTNSFAIYALSGKLIQKEKFEGERFIRNVNLPNGIYIVQVNAGLNTVSKKVVVR